MKDFKATVPSICSRAINAFRSEDPSAILDALSAIEAPFDEELEAELIALGYVHREAKVRKKAMGLVKKHVAAAADFKAAYGSMAGAAQHVVAERIRAFDHPYRLNIAKAVLFHRLMAASIPLEQDPAIRKELLAVMLGKAKREGEKEISLGEVYWYWKNSSGWATHLDLHELPGTLFAELGRLRKEYPFDGVSFHGGSLTALPDEMAKAKSWLKSLTLSWNPFETLPDVLFACTNLETLKLCGTALVDIPADIAKLKKLRHLDIGNGKKMKEIPASVCALGHVEVLRIGNGSIRKIPDAIGQMQSLRELQMQSTNITKVPASLGSLPNLKKIRMAFSRRLDRAKVKAIVGSGVKVEV